MSPREVLHIGSDTATLCATSADSDGALLAFEVRIPAGGGPPFMHRHDAAEIYRVEDGELAIYVEDDAGDVRRHAIGPGATHCIAGRRSHTVRNESDADAHAYVVFSPGAAIEDFFRAAAALTSRDRTPAPEDVMALAAAHGVEMAGPVPV